MVAFFVLTFRFLPFVMDAFKRITLAQYLRGVPVFSKNPVVKIKSFFSIIIPLIVYLEKKSEDIALSLELRFFDGNYKNLKMEKLFLRDFALIFLFFLVFFCLFYF